MTGYAELDKQNIVINVIVADQEFINALPNYKRFVILSRGGIGWKYDITANVFIAPQPFESWTLDDDYDWQPPIAQPSQPPKTYWNETTQSWDTYAQQ